MDMASGAVGGITSLATGIASGDPRAIIDGAMQMLDVVGKVINANKQANEEIRKFQPLWLSKPLNIAWPLSVQ